MLTMIIALFFGFLHNFIAGYNFERLHIFLFNLCTGGTIILFYTLKFTKMTFFIFLFFFGSFIYAILSFYQYYLLAIVIAVCLVLIVEYVRWDNFGHIIEFFKLTNSVYNKFHHASLLCLSIGLVLSIFAIINEYTGFYYIKTLSLNRFFLGFSFPISLITFSIIFKLINEKLKNKKLLAESSFWTINLGVIVFFIFILMEHIYLELLISIILGVSVFFVFYVFVKTCGHIQQKYFLMSGMYFLLATALTGILYIILFIKNPGNKALLNKVIDYHRLISLYGWNLSGLAIIVRYGDFPIRLNSRHAIALHWLTVGVLAPIAIDSAIFSVVTIGFYTLFLLLIFFSKSSIEKNMMNNI